MTMGRDLRRKIEAIDELLGSVEEFLREKGVLDEETKHLIDKAWNALDALYYHIPLEEASDE